MKTARLGVNIDHVATLRQQRGEFYPEVTRAAEVSLATGADQITIHLREDRRHIQDRDVPAVHTVCKKFNQPLNLNNSIDTSNLTNGIYLFKITSDEGSVISKIIKN